VVALAITAVGASAVAASVPAAAQQPIGVGPVPITFNFTDQDGKWMDSGLNLFGDQSLAVAEMPRLGISGGGLLSGANLTSMTNADQGDALSNLVKSVGGTVPALGSLGQSLWKTLNLDSTLSAVQQIGASNAQAASDTAKAQTLLGQFASQVASMPADQPINLGSGQFQVGVELQGVLNDLMKFAQEGPPVTVKLDVNPSDSQGIRDPVGLIAPEGAAGFPYDDAKGAYFGEKQIQLTKPGLYAFADRITPYELGAVVVDDPLTLGLDFGNNMQVGTRNLTVPSNSDIIQRLVNAFFNITNPNNWQVYKPNAENTWKPIFPPVPILEHDAAGNPVLIPNLDAYFDQKFGYPQTLAKGDQHPTIPGVGEVWLDTQMEDWAGKDKTGSVTEINPTDWSIERKIGAPGIDMNNAHNQWTDADGKYLYVTEWFADKLDVFDRTTGAFIRQQTVGHNPAHVQTETDTGNLLIGDNAGNELTELAPGGTSVLRQITVSPTGEIRHPHAHWISADGKTVITPNTKTDNISVIDVPTGTVKTEPAMGLPIASSMTSDASRAYVANFLGSSITCVSLAANACVDDHGQKQHLSTIDLWQNYSPIDGPKGGPLGGLPIQIPVSPDDHAMIADNVFSGTLSVIDPRTNKIVKELPCGLGCHGGNFGAKKGGGYYDYVSTMFTNRMEIIDPDPNNDGDLSDAKVAGTLVLAPTAATKMDGAVTDHGGMGGEGVGPLPLVYNGWVQQNQGDWRNSLTCQQLNPINQSVCG
jgi:DNA-binding beta-propeller fold protein YncE